MTRLTLHIGDPKTGTSSIQGALFNRRFECDSKTLDYPATLSAFMLANTLKKRRRASQKDQRFADIAAWLAASKADVAVISAEQFSTVDPATVLQAFQEFIPDHAESMRVVAYARPHVSRFLSAYAQRTKVGTLFSDLDSFFSEEKNANLLNFHSRFLKWRDLVGDRFVLRPMVRPELLDGDVVADFLGIVLEGAPFRILGEAESNSSLPMEPLSGLRLVHQVLRKFEIGEGTRQAVGSKITTFVAAAGNKGTKLQPSKALYAKLADYCMADAEKLDRDFFGKPIMVSALVAAEKEAVDGNYSGQAKDFYPAEVVKVLRGHGRKLAKLFQTQPGIWDAAFRRERGQIAPLSPDEQTPEQASAFVGRVNDTLAELAVVLTSG
ncbi:MAG: hypothetical protein ABI832_12200, partial [bacterium]